MEKLVRDGCVGVVYSPGFGAGWSSWNMEHAETLCMDAEIVQAVLDENTKLAATLAEQKCEGVYTGGAGQLTVQWLPQGTLFEIDEYDGNESISIMHNKSWLKA